MASLKELLVSNRVKTVLSECMVNHVLRSEVSLPRAFAAPNELADILDKYGVNFDQNGRPRVSAIGLGMIWCDFFHYLPTLKPFNGFLSHVRTILHINSNSRPYKF